MNSNVKTHVANAIKKGFRLDGRKNDEFRKISFEVGSIFTAEGSAKIIAGESELLVGVKLTAGTPFPDTPDDGVLMVNCELRPLASPHFEEGPPSIDSIETSRVIDRGIRESGSLDTKSLCIKKGELVWMVQVDIVPLNADGNLIDLGAIASLAALRVTRFPKLENGKVVFGELTDEKLKLSEFPIPVTVHKIGNNLIVDPTEAEEQASDARITITTLDDKRVCAMQKGGDQPFSEEELKKALDLAFSKAKDLRAQIAAL
ncbi:MAG: exosome complex protein Rrp42 [Candidatus Woesearchaeota archaeon]|nr:MAG: exosome complex protein Rrp42 [Candidatus Woesearchaeota archaeon]